MLMMAIFLQAGYIGLPIRPEKGVAHAASKQVKQESYSTVPEVEVTLTDCSLQSY